MIATEFRTGSRLPCARRLALDAKFGLLRIPGLAPGVDRGLLRAQHLELPIGSVVLRLRYLSLSPVSGLLLIRHLAFSYCLQIALHSPLSKPCISRGLLRDSYFMLRAGTF